MTQSIDFDSLGDFCKKFEQTDTNRVATPGGVLLARLDGRAFHTLTKGMKKPFDETFMSIMVECTKSLVREFHADVGYTQSDEISLAWTLKKPESQWPFRGSFQKLDSILAAHCSVRFDRLLHFHNLRAAENAQGIETFDCRSWQVPDLETAGKTFMWRQWDAERNSVNMLASSHFSHKDLQGVSTKDRIDMLAKKGVSYGDLSDAARRGTFIALDLTEVPFDDASWNRIPPEHRPSEKVRLRKELRIHHSPLRSVEDPSLLLFNRPSRPTQASTWKPANPVHGHYQETL